MARKHPFSIHIKMPKSMQLFIDKRCKELNKQTEELEQKWDRSKYIRWLVRRDMKEDSK